MANEIVLGYDGSDGAKAAVPHGVALALAFDVPLVLAFAHGANPVGGVAGDLSRAAAEVGRTFLDEGAALARDVDAKVKIKTVLVNAMPVEGLVGLAEESKARMLVVGGNGHGTLIGTLLGSIDYKILHQTVVPVLVVQPPD
jgi:nucleotide-binding universal stress UspA family protein